MLNGLGLGLTFTAVDLASGVIQNLNSNLNQLQMAANTHVPGLNKLIAGVGGGVAATAAGVGALAGTFKLANKSIDLEHALGLVKIVSHATDAEMDAMKKFALTTANTLGKAPVEAVEGLRILAQQGYSVQKSLDMLPGVLKFAAAGEMEVEEAASLASQALRAFELDSKYFPVVMDQMQGAADMFSMATKDLNIGLARASAGAGLYRASLTETITLFGLVKDVLGSTMMSGTSVSYIMSRLTKIKTQDEIKKALGVDVVDRATGGFKRILPVIGEMSKALEKLPRFRQTDMLKKWFGEEGVKGFEALMARINAGVEDNNHQIHKGMDGLNTAFKMVAGQYGTLDNASQEVMSRMHGRIEQLKSSWDSFLTALGEPFRNAWSPVVDSMTTGLRDMTNSLMKADQDTLAFGANLLVAALAGYTFFAALGLAKYTLPLLGTGMKLLATAGWEVAAGFGASLLAMWPLLVIGLAIGAMIYAIRENMWGLGDAWDKIWGKMSLSFAGFSTFFRDAWAIISDAFSGTIDMMEPAIDVLMWGLDFLANRVAELGKQFDGLLGGPGEGMRKFFRFLGAAAGLVFTSFVFVGSAVVAVISTIVGVVVKIIEVLGHFFGAVFGWVLDVFGLTKKGKETSGVSHVLKSLNGGYDREKAAAAASAEAQKTPGPRMSMLPEALSSQLTGPAASMSVSSDYYRPIPKGGDWDRLGALLQSDATKRTSASEKMSYYDGVIPSGPNNSLTADDIKRAFEKAQFNVYFDNNKMVGYIREANASEAAASNALYSE